MVTRGSPGGVARRGSCLALSLSLTWQVVHAKPEP